MSEFVNFLFSLALNASFNAQFQAAPMDTMRSFGLSEQEIEIVNKGDAEKLKAHLGGDVNVVSSNIQLAKQ